jgi:hypothetical protein
LGEREGVRGSRIMPSYDELLIKGFERACEK